MKGKEKNQKGKMLESKSKREKERKRKLEEKRKGIKREKP